MFLDFSVIQLSRKVSEIKLNKLMFNYNQSQCSCEALKLDPKDYSIYYCINRVRFCLIAALSNLLCTSNFLGPRVSLFTFSVMKIY